jgi:hypothetical protein
LTVGTRDLPQSFFALPPLQPFVGGFVLAAISYLLASSLRKHSEEANRQKIMQIVEIRFFRERPREMKKATKIKDANFSSSKFLLI